MEKRNSRASQIMLPGFQEKSSIAIIYYEEPTIITAYEYQKADQKGKFMTNLIQKTSAAYSYPLLIKSILYNPVIDSPETEIVYRGDLRFTYKEFRERVCRLANSLVNSGVKPGDTVAVMDWDSHRYLECFFAVPMIGAVLHTVNIKLSVEQILYTINHAEDDFILVNQEFLPLIEQIRGRIDLVKGFMPKFKVPMFSLLPIRLGNGC